MSIQVPARQGAPTPDVERNKTLVRDFHERLWGHHDVSVIDEVFAPDATLHIVGFDGSAVETFWADVTRYHTAFTDIESSVLALLGEGDRVVLHWTTTGTHIGTYGKVEATGKRIAMSGIDIFRISGDRIVECWSMWDGLDVYDQMGVLPELW